MSLYQVKMGSLKDKLREREAEKAREQKKKRIVKKAKVIKSIKTTGRKFIRSNK